MSDVPEKFFVLMDPAWSPEPQPPFAAVIGLWPVQDDGGVGGFRGNPDYVPSRPGAPADPIDAALLAADLDRVQVLLRDCLVEIGVDEAGRPVVADSPDDVPCLLVVTSPGHRDRAPGVPAWRAADLDDLITVLDDDVDVLLNPGGARMTRLGGGFVREALGLDDRDAAALLTRAGARPMTVIPWSSDRSPTEGPR